MFGVFPSFDTSFIATFVVVCYLVTRNVRDGLVCDRLWSKVLTIPILLIGVTMLIIVYLNVEGFWWGLSVKWLCTLAYQICLLHCHTRRGGHFSSPIIASTRVPSALSDSRQKLLADRILSRWFLRRWLFFYICIPTAWSIINFLFSSYYSGAWFWERLSASIWCNFSYFRRVVNQWCCPSFL